MNKVKVNKVNTFDAQIQQGMALLVGELEKLDPKLNEPLMSVTWMRDIPVRTGAGWVDYTSHLFPERNANFTTVGNSTNNITTVSANKTKKTFGTHTEAIMLQIPYVELKKNDYIGSGLETMLDTGVRQAYDLMLDENAYTGLSKIPNSYGLINSPDVIATAAVKGNWATATPDEILNDINTAIQAVWEATAFDPAGLPNQILLPAKQFSLLSTRRLGDYGNISIIKFLEENNIASLQGSNLRIVPCKQCAGAGVGAKDRMVIYRNDVDRVNFELCVPLYREATQFNNSLMVYQTPYLTHIGEAKFLYSETALYVDGI